MNESQTVDRSRVVASVPSTGGTQSRQVEALDATLARVRPEALLVGILGLAALVRFLGLSAFALWGDEYRSIGEATTHFGANLTSVIYPFALRASITFGTSVDLLRLPAVIFGVAAVGAIYLLASTLVDRRTAVAAALLMATSSYAVGYSQQVRFYSLFLLGGTLALHSCALVLRDGPSQARVAWLIVANVFCVATDGLGVLVLAAEVATFLLLTAAPSDLWRRAALLAGAFLLAIVALSTRQAGVLLTFFLNRYQDSHASYSGPHGLHLASLVKIPWTFYVFVFGERVYPLWLWITLPGTILALLFIGRGVWALRGNRIALGTLLPPLLLGPVAMYLVFDAVMPTGGLPSASPRYLIPLLSPFLLLMAAGAVSWRARWRLVLSVALALTLNSAALVLYWQNAWNYNGLSPDWPRVERLVAHGAPPGTLLLVDGRSSGPTDYYLAGLAHSRHLVRGNLESLTGPVHAPRVIAVADTDRAVDRAAINRTLAALQRRYAVVDGFVRYPLFAYVLAGTSAAEPSPSAPGWRPVHLPVAVYDLQLTDLALPASIRLPGAGGFLITRGGFEVSGTPGSALTLSGTSPSRHLLLATTLEDARSLPDGAPVAALTFWRGALHKTVVLRKGLQVDDWRRAGEGPRPQGAVYTTGYRWTKLLALVGSRSYADAFRQFTAGIAVTSIPAPLAGFDRVSFRYVAPSGTLHVWAAAVSTERRGSR